MHRVKENSKVEGFEYKKAAKTLIYYFSNGWFTAYRKLYCYNENPKI